MRPLVFSSLFGLAALAAGAAHAGDIEVRNAWIRATTAGMPTAAAYATITNHAISSDRLTGARTSAATSAELHQMTTSGGVMRMRAMLGGIPIGASASINLSPNGEHLMLVGVKGPLTAGAHVKITLQFQRAGSVVADFTVRYAAPGMHM
jgi:periplasmic copper chaperone A